MNLVTHEKLAVITLPENVCFYQQSASQFIQDLSHLAESLHKSSNPQTHGILLLQPQSAQDAVESWINELKYECLFNDLVHRIDAWRWLLSLIRNSPVPWIYASADNCFGSSWELALSCHHRYWFKSKALVGFPEIEAGVFPPGGLLESLSKRAGRTRERWQASPLNFAKNALSDGLIDYCSDATNWREQALRIFSELLEVNPTSGIRAHRRTRPRHDFVSVDAQSRRMAYQQVESVAQQEKFGKASGPTAWDYCWQLVSERAKLRQPADLGRIIGLIASRYLLLSQYSTWLEKQIVSSHAKATTLLNDRRVASAPIAIDLNHSAPPAAVITRLVENNKNVILVASEQRDLVTGLNLLFGRLERNLGNVAAEYLWDRNVTWSLGRPLGFSGTVLSWMPDDYLVCSNSGADYSFLRLEGNHLDATPGIMEFSSSEPNLPLSIRDVLDSICDGVIWIPEILGLRMPLSVRFRSLFLEELIQAALYTDHDLSIAVSALQRAGWAFAGDESSWERFLRTRRLFNPTKEASFLSPDFLQIDPDLNTWRTAKIKA